MSINWGPATRLGKSAARHCALIIPRNTTRVWQVLVLALVFPVAGWTGTWIVQNRCVQESNGFIRVGQPRIRYRVTEPPVNTVPVVIFFKQPQFPL